MNLPDLFFRILDHGGLAFSLERYNKKRLGESRSLSQCNVYGCVLVSWSDDTQSYCLSGCGVRREVRTQCVRGGDARSVYRHDDVASH